MLRNPLAAARSASLIVLSAVALLAAAAPGLSVAQEKSAAPSATDSRAQAPAAVPGAAGSAPASAPGAGAAPLQGSPIEAAGGQRTTKDAIENPYGLEALWKGSDFVAKAVLVLLLLMSMGSWYIIFTKFIEQGRIRRQARGVDDGFWSAQTVRQGAEKLEDGSPFRFIA
ncbi:MAG TPA: MotA/TolQ/ExbB proton channel family protein, partial [Burkholderiaceae bacterium]|nr:MotA/TolQ/ExbB proton channel family protein [Burkholderiaceae bacterium]